MTIKDVAELAEVSLSTVSRVCNGSPVISRETREKVRRAMAQLNYEPAPSASFSSGARLIGVVLPPAHRLAYENPFYLKALWGISRFCSQRRYHRRHRRRAGRGGDLGGAPDHAAKRPAGGRGGAVL